MFTLSLELPGSSTFRTSHFHRFAHTAFLSPSGANRRARCFVPSSLYSICSHQKHAHAARERGEAPGLRFRRFGRKFPRRIRCNASVHWLLAGQKLPSPRSHSIPLSAVATLNNVPSLLLPPTLSTNTHRHTHKLTVPLITTACKLKGCRKRPRPANRSKPRSCARWCVLAFGPEIGPDAAEIAARSACVPSEVAGMLPHPGAMDPRASCNGHAFAASV